MTARQIEWPRCWLMTDERLGELLWEVVGRLPAGAGVVLRHYSLSPAQRRDMGERLRPLCRNSGLILAVARDADLAIELEAPLVHNPHGSTNGLPFSRAVHSLAGAEAARAEGAALVFVSPMHATRSHPGAKPLDRELARRIVRACGCPAIALGGMDANRFAEAAEDGFYGWAGIDAWLRT